jgi:hypothetical protein
VIETCSRMFVMLFIEGNFDERDVKMIITAKSPARIPPY